MAQLDEGPPDLEADLRLAAQNASRTSARPAEGASACGGGLVTLEVVEAPEGDDDQTLRVEQVRALLALAEFLASSPSNRRKERHAA